MVHSIHWVHQFDRMEKNGEKKTRNERVNYKYSIREKFIRDQI